MKLNPKIVSIAVMAIVILVVVFQTYASIVPEAQTAGDELTNEGRCTAVSCEYNATGGIANEVCYTDTNYNVSCGSSYKPVPLGSLFGSTGVVFVIIMAALMILIVKTYMGKKK